MIVRPKQQQLGTKHNVNDGNQDTLDGLCPSRGRSWNQRYRFLETTTTCWILQQSPTTSPSVLATENSRLTLRPSLLLVPCVVTNDVDLENNTSTFNWLNVYHRPSKKKPLPNMVNCSGFSKLKWVSPIREIRQMANLQRDFARLSLFFWHDHLGQKYSHKLSGFSTWLAKTFLFTSAKEFRLPTWHGPIRFRAKFGTRSKFQQIWLTLSSLWVLRPGISPERISRSSRYFKEGQKPVKYF